MRLFSITNRVFKQKIVSDLRAMRVRIPVSILCVVCTMYVIFFVTPVRNVIFYPAVEYAWRDMDTYDLIRIHFAWDNAPAGVFDNVSCSTAMKPPASREDIDASKVLAYSGLLHEESRIEALRKGHGRFLPAVSLDQKLDNLHLYLVATKILASFGAQHFLVAGSLLGFNRHRGLVPWDDDLDIAVSLESWPAVKERFSCVEGFKLVKEHVLHWKFRFADRTYPFLDIFFYRMDERYVWAMTHYTRKTFIYPTRDVFPLAYGEFEGISVPVPRHSLRIARRIYDYDTCRAYQGHIQRNISDSSTHPYGYYYMKVPCAELSYLYPMYHLQS